MYVLEYLRSIKTFYRQSDSTGKSNPLTIKKKEGTDNEF